MKRGPDQSFSGDSRRRRYAAGLKALATRLSGGPRSVEVKGWGGRGSRLSPSRRHGPPRNRRRAGVERGGDRAQREGDHGRRPPAHDKSPRLCDRRLQFTHVAAHQAGIVLRNALFRWPAKAGAAAISWVTYADPELAQVGLSEPAAKTAGHTVTIARFPFAEIDRVRTERETDGFAKIVLGRRGKILGATIVGRGAGELILPWVLAIDAGFGIGAISGWSRPIRYSARSRNERPDPVTRRSCSRRGPGRSSGRSNGSAEGGPVLVRRAKRPAGCQNRVVRLVSHAGEASTSTASTRLS